MFLEHGTVSFAFFPASLSLFTLKRKVRDGAAETDP